MRIEINDWDLVENNDVYFKGRVALAQAWLDLFSDFGDVPLDTLVAPANKFATSKKLPFRVIEAVSQNEEGEIDWIIEFDNDPQFDSAGFSIADRFEDDEEESHHCDDPGCNCTI